MTSSVLPGMALLATIAFPVASPSVEPLRHDVFARPFSVQSSLTVGDSRSEAASVTWSPRLTATMVAGKASLITVDGTIVKVGEEIEGFRLMTVKEGKAIFLKDGQRIELSMPATGVAVPKLRNSQ